MRNTIKLLEGIAAIFCLSSFSSCKNDKVEPPPPTLVKQWSVALHAAYENPAPAGRTETGVAELQLYSDYSLKYHIMLNSLASGDVLTNSHIHWGDATTNGPVILNFSPSFAANMATGTVTGVRTTLADSIQTGTVYVNVHSTQFPGGLVRGQMDKTIDFAIDVALSGANEVPANTTTATGTALLRLTSDKTLFSKVTVTNLEAGDALTAAHIHNGAAGVNGGVLQGLCASAADFGISKSVVLDDAKVTAIKTAPVYVNAHSTSKPAGIIRGQIR